jgi:hypothetical protein
MKPKIKITVKDVYVRGATCCVCDCCITHNSEDLILACNEEENLVVCRSCLKEGIAGIEQRLRANVAARRAALPELIETAKQIVAELTAELADESISLDNGLVGRLQVPDFAEYTQAVADIVLMDQLASMADDVSPPEIPTAADLAEINALYE